MTMVRQLKYIVIWVATVILFNLMIWSTKGRFRRIVCKIQTFPREEVLKSLKIAKIIWQNCTTCYRSNNATLPNNAIFNLQRSSNARPDV